MQRLFRRFADPDPAALDVAHPGGTVTVALRRRAAAKRMTLRVSAATGAVALTLPPGVRLASARDFLQAQSGWIATRLAGLPDRASLLPGTDVPLRGVPTRILHRGPGRDAVRLASDEAGDQVLWVSGDLAAVPGRVRRYLRAEAERDLREAATRHALALGCPVRRITLRDTRSRWGSCSSSGGLSFSWRLILAPPFVLDYLAAHEVGHLKELNHSDRFWRIVHGLCPRTGEAEAWLRRHGAALHRIG